jgi:hypothetical protein
MLDTDIMSKAFGAVRAAYDFVTPMVSSGMKHASSAKDWVLSLKVASIVSGVFTKLGLGKIPAFVSSNPQLSLVIGLAAVNVVVRLLSESGDTEIEDISKRVGELEARIPAV